MNLSGELLIFVYLVLAQTLASPTLVRRDADFDSVRTRLDRSYQDLGDDDLSDKYFHEATFHQHYDGRFADHPLDYNERRSHLRALIQTYLSSMDDIGAETWIMHGSLLGWWWNRRILPWDSDLDVMISEKSIHHLAAYYNMTIHHYALPGLNASRDYLLEVNPHYVEDAIDEVNKIDARWIDTDTGLFIDITTLRRNTSASAVEGAVSVKDNHHYMYDDIYPLRESVFEGFPVKLPYAYADVLLEEYGEKALSEVLFEDHHFDTEKEEWIPLRYAERVRHGRPRLLSYWGGAAKQVWPD